MKVKIPLKLAGVIGVDRYYIKKINQGIRRPSLKTAGQLVGPAVREGPGAKQALADL